MNHLIDVTKKEDIFPEYQDNPIGKLLEYHNLNRALDEYEKAEILIGMCMDHRKLLHLPDRFAYVIRTAGANLRYNEFNISYAVAIADIKHIVVIGHSNCGMVDLFTKKSKFINGLVENVNWGEQQAQEHFLKLAPKYEIGDEKQFTISEVRRLRLRYPNITVAPLFYKLENNNLYQIKES